MPRLLEMACCFPATHEGEGSLITASPEHQSVSSNVLLPFVRLLPNSCDWAVRYVQRKAYRWRICLKERHMNFLFRLIAAITNRLGGVSLPIPHLKDKDS